MSVAMQDSIPTPPSVHLMAAWPLFLVVIGGAIGLVFAVLAYMINLRIYHSPLSKINKILANIMCGMSAISGWWFMAQWVQSTF